MTGLGCTGILTKPRFNGPHVLICGPKDAGKTTLMNCYLEMPNSLKSNTANIDWCTGAGGDMLLIDVSSHKGLNNQATQFANEADVIMLVVESGNRRHARAAQQLLSQLFNVSSNDVQAKEYLLAKVTGRPPRSPSVDMRCQRSKIQTAIGSASAATDEDTVRLAEADDVSGRSRSLSDLTTDTVFSVRPSTSAMVLSMSPRSSGGGSSSSSPDTANLRHCDSFVDWIGMSEPYRGFHLKADVRVVVANNKSDKTKDAKHGEDLKTILQIDSTCAKVPWCIIDTSGATGLGIDDLATWMCGVASSVPTGVLS